MGEYNPLQNYLKNGKKKISKTRYQIIIESEYKDVLQIQEDKYGEFYTFSKKASFLKQVKVYNQNTYVQFILVNQFLEIKERETIYLYYYPFTKEYYDKNGEVVTNIEDMNSYWIVGSVQLREIK